MRPVTLQCPHCRRSLEADESQRGRRLRCPHADCRRLFRWREDGTCVAEAEAARVTVGNLPVVYRDWRSEPPPRRQTAAATAIEEAPATTQPAEESDEVSLEELRALGLSPERLRGHSRAGLWTALFFLGLLGLTGLIGWVAFRAEQSREPHLAREAEKLFREGQYSQALTKYRDLLRQFPGSSRRGEYLFYEHACLLRALLSNPRVDIHRLAQTATQFLRDYERSPQFAEHRRDLAEALYQVARRTLEEARVSLDRLLLDQVQEIYTALKEKVGFGLGDAGVRSNELAQGIQQTDYAIRLAEARNRLQLAIQAAFHLQRPTFVAQAQELFHQLRRDFPELGKDEALLKPLAQLAELESTWLAHVAWGQWQAALNYVMGSEGLPCLPVGELCHLWFPIADSVWQVQASSSLSGSTSAGASSPTPAGAQPPVVVLSEGHRLLAVHTGQGRELWTATIAGEKNLRVVYRDVETPRVYAWAPERRVLAALDSSSGRVLWARKLPGYAPFAPSVSPPWWWLAEPSGWVWYGETESGEVQGAFGLDYPLTASLGVNSLTSQAGLATHQKRVFVLDPRSRQARVAMTDHQTGSLAGHVVVLPSGLLLPVAQGEQIQLVGVALASPNTPATASATSLLRWPGRQIVQVASNGETAVMLTDRREVVLAQTASPPGSRLRILGGGKWTLNLPVAPGKADHLAVQLLGERLGAWWLVSSNGQMLRLFWDDYREQLVQESYSLPAGELLDFAWDRSQPGRLILLLRSTGEGRRVLAWDIAQASVVWNRALPPTRAGDKASGQP
ncbi:MAG: hypothetical protein NZM42_01930 [Gemmatales bacterium]|nr:hypothetical protein [Gemmatales bacterium]